MADITNRVGNEYQGEIIEKTTGKGREDVHGLTRRLAVDSVFNLMEKSIPIGGGGLFSGNVRFKPVPTNIFLHFDSKKLS